MCHSLYQQLIAPTTLAFDCDWLKNIEQTMQK